MWFHGVPNNISQRRSHNEGKFNRFSDWVCGRQFYFWTIRYSAADTPSHGIDGYPAIDASSLSVDGYSAVSSAPYGHDGHPAADSAPFSRDGYPATNASAPCVS